jgi:ribose transport system substrate-binding protein
MNAKTSIKLMCAASLLALGLSFGTAPAAAEGKLPSKIEKIGMMVQDMSVECSNRQQTFAENRMRQAQR